LYTSATHNVSMYRSSVSTQSGITNDLVGTRNIAALIGRNEKKKMVGFVETLNVVITYVVGMSKTTEG